MSDEKKGGDRKTITLDTDALAELIEAKVAARLSALNVAEIKSLDDRFADDMAALRGTNRPPLPEELHKCKSPITGATFTARVVSSRTFPRGRVVDLLDYTHPEGIDAYVADGGLVPQGMLIAHEGKLTAAYKMWRYQNFWKRDLLDLVGKPFALYYTVEEAARREAIEASRRPPEAA